MNEAFAAQMLACNKDLQIDSQINIHGGAPLGRDWRVRHAVLVTRSRAERRNLKRGLASLCLGGGNAVAMIGERITMSALSTNRFQPTAPPTLSPLPLEDGDHLSVDEFLRRWDALPETWKAEHRRAELIEGVVRMPPISGGSHARPQFNFIGFLGAYTWVTPGVMGGDAASIIFDQKTMPEPDAFLAIDPNCGGRIRFDERGFIHGSPEMLAEISSSSVSFDLHAKKELNRKFEVQDYAGFAARQSNRLVCSAINNTALALVGSRHLSQQGISRPLARGRCAHCRQFPTSCCVLTKDSLPPSIKHSLNNF